VIVNQQVRLLIRKLFNGWHAQLPTWLAEN